MRILVLLLTILTITSTSLATTIDESMKRCIYEIISPRPCVTVTGTGFTISDSQLGFVLVTCKHVVQDDKGEYVDSIFLRRNKMLVTEQAISDTSRFVLRLKVNGRPFVAEHPNHSVDLVMIPLLSFNTTLSPGESPYGLRSRVVLSKEQWQQKGFNEGTEVEIIGFPLLLPQNCVHYHFSRYGKIGLYTTDQFTLIIDNKPKTANYILLDMVVRPGLSGSPVFAHIAPDTTYLIGFLSAHSQEGEYAIGYPVYYLYDLMEIVKKQIQEVSQSKR